MQLSHSSEEYTYVYMSICLYVNQIVLLSPFICEIRLISFAFKAISRQIQCIHQRVNNTKAIIYSEHVKSMICVTIITTINKMKRKKKTCKLSNTSHIHIQIQVDGWE